MIYCPSCLHEWKEDENREKIKANGIQCVYCNVFFIDLNFVKQILQDNNVSVNFNFKHINDGDNTSARE